MFGWKTSQHDHPIVGKFLVRPAKADFEFGARAGIEQYYQSYTQQWLLLNALIVTTHSPQNS